MDNSVNTPASLRALLSDLIDYAGLFPPAGLPMRQAVENYARYLAGPDAWALARFVLPVSRFAEFEAAIAGLQFPETWCLSALVGPNADADLRAINQFNHRNTKRVDVDTIEVKAESIEAIHRISALVPKAITAYFEVPPESAEKLIPAIHDVDGRAKIRTGGVTPDAFPPSETVARFLWLCAEHGVAFKATAGLHHPMRCKKPLTYEPDAPVGSMHGFLNVFVLAAFTWASGKTFQINEEHRFHGVVMTPPFPYSAGGGNEIYRTDLLKRVSPFQFNDSGLQEPFPMPASVIADARQSFAISFGSCSFEEPLADLRELKLL